MSCLGELVDVWDLCSEKDPAKVYINDLPGFSMSILEAITTEEHPNAVERGRELIEDAATQNENEIRNFIDQRVTIPSLIENQTLGQYADNLRIMPAVSGYLAGVRMRIPNIKNSAFYLQSFTIFTPNAVSGPLQVIDLTRGIVLDTIPFTSTAGQYSLVQVGKRYRNVGQFLNLFIGYTSSDTYRCEPFPGCGSCGPRWKWHNMYVEAMGARIAVADQKIDTNIRGESHSNGLSINYQLECDTTNFICSISPRLKTAQQYKAGIRIMEEVIHSRRQNSITTIEKQDAIDWINAYQPKFDQLMQAVMENIALPNEPCFYCKPIIQTVTSVP